MKRTQKGSESLYILLIQVKGLFKWLNHKINLSIYHDYELLEYV